MRSENDKPIRQVIESRLRELHSDTMRSPAFTGAVRRKKASLRHKALNYKIIRVFRRLLALRRGFFSCILFTFNDNEMLLYGEIYLTPSVKADQAVCFNQER